MDTLTLFLSLAGAVLLSALLGFGLYLLINGPVAVGLVAAAWVAGVVRYRSTVSPRPKP